MFFVRVVQSISAHARMTEDEPGDEKIEKHQLDLGRYLLDCPFIRAYLDALVSSKKNRSQKARAISLEESRITVKLARMDFARMGLQYWWCDVYFFPYQPTI